MTISQLTFNPPSRAEYASTQNDSQVQQSFAITLNQAQESLTDRAQEAREVLRLLRECLLGELSYSEEDMELLSSYNFAKPFSSAGYDHYREVSVASAPHYASESMATSQLPNSTAGADSAEPVAAQDNLRANIEQLIDQVAQDVGLSATLIRSVVSAESSFQPDAVSPVGAQGLMQLMPGTAADLGVENSFDPQQNLLGGSRYLKQLLTKYDGDIDQALAAYNWGPGNVDRNGLEQLPTETRNYIAKVKQASSNFG
ncbi:MAG: lytic transglycosylase domain-containing protein [Desulfuromonas sp.]|nr:lytic transglycosylase domain-containing protein [Desulfuromonas sp.]